MYMKEKNKKERNKMLGENNSSFYIDIKSTVVQNLKNNLKVFGFNKSIIQKIAKYSYIKLIAQIVLKIVLHKENRTIFI